eukprot:GHVQ01001435.1.p1 GENE.GHVQ01001435.1~~GHVQ01001435.1.p1  ORF type:complete len:593 (+),score=69.04 GHVQ01001435.1:571-2349(+)
MTGRSSKRSAHSRSQRNQLNYALNKKNIQQVRHSIESCVRDSIRPDDSISQAPDPVRFSPSRNDRRTELQGVDEISCDLVDSEEDEGPESSKTKKPTSYHWHRPGKRSMLLTPMTPSGSDPERDSPQNSEWYRLRIPKHRRSQSDDENNSEEGGPLQVAEEQHQQLLHEGPQDHTEAQPSNNTLTWVGSFLPRASTLSRALPTALREYIFEETPEEDGDQHGKGIHMAKFRRKSQSANYLSIEDRGRDFRGFETALLKSGKTGKEKRRKSVAVLWCLVWLSAVLVGLGCLGAGIMVTLHYTGIYDSSHLVDLLFGKTAGPPCSLIDWSDWGVCNSFCTNGTMWRHRVFNIADESSQENPYLIPTSRVDPVTEFADFTAAESPVRAFPTDSPGETCTREETSHSLLSEQAACMGSCNIFYLAFPSDVSHFQDDLTGCQLLLRRTLAKELNVALPRVNVPTLRLDSSTADDYWIAEVYIDPSNDTSLSVSQGDPHSRAFNETSRGVSFDDVMRNPESQLRQSLNPCVEPRGQAGGAVVKITDLADIFNSIRHVSSSWPPHLPLPGDATGLCCTKLSVANSMNKTDILQSWLRLS